MSSIYAGQVGMVGEGMMSRAELLAGHLPTMRPTSQEIQMALHFPNDSEILHAWLGTDGGRIEVDRLAEGDEHFGDLTWRQGRIILPGDVERDRFEYRAEPPGRGSRAFFASVGWLMAENLQPRGYLAGRIVPRA